MTVIIVKTVMSKGPCVYAYVHICVYIYIHVYCIHIKHIDIVYICTCMCMGAGPWTWPQDPGRLCFSARAEKRSRPCREKPETSNWQSTSWVEMLLLEFKAFLWALVCTLSFFKGICTMGPFFEGGL